MKKFEYLTYKVDRSFWQGRIDDDSLQNNLNALGQRGWELISTLETNTIDGRTNEVLLFFKREIIA